MSLTYAAPLGSVIATTTAGRPVFVGPAQRTRTPVSRSIVASLIVRAPD